ncbi:MAG: hypothetical protein ACRDHP_12685 [Ktedonobacterales bacterium]
MRDIGDSPSAESGAQREPSVQPPTSASPLPARTPQRARRRAFAVTVVAAVLLVALLAGTVFTLHAIPTRAPAPARHPQPPIELQVFSGFQNSPPCATSSFGPTATCPESQFVCPRDAVWSPNDTQVAILSECLGGGSNDAQVFVYDARSGQRLLEFDLLAELQRLPNMPAPGRNTTLCTVGIPEAYPTLTSYALLWSQDGTRLEIPFYLTYRTGLPMKGSCYGWSGLLRMNPDGGAPQAFVHATNPADPFADGLGNDFAPVNKQCFRVWDLETGTLVPAAVDTSPGGQASYNCLTPALAYSWGANGSLIPATPLPPAGAPAANACPAPGNPNGDATISIWQPGAITRGTPPAPYQNTPPFHTWYTSAFAAASPDGRYVAYTPLFDELVASSRLAMPDAAALVAAQYDSPPVLPVPGRVIEQRLAALPAAYAADQEVAFRPDGRVVATGGIEVVASSTSQAQPVSKPVVLYDCASGRQLATLSPILDSADVGRGYPDKLLRWSPDGKYLLYVDGSYGAATIWGPDQLPH